MFLTILLFIILGIWLLGFLMRWLLPWLMLRAAKKYGAQFGAGFGGATGANGRTRSSSQQANRKEGEIRVENTADTPSHKVSRDLGDYVEFEEEK